MALDLAPLGNLRRLARALAHGDADADDLLQDTAIAAIQHPPDEDRPLGPWFVVVLRNRWKMNRRAESRRLAREAAVEVAAEQADASEPLDRARLLQRLADALVALDEPYRTTVIRRYLDGMSAAKIAREQDVPAGTVRWRLKTGLARLRVALDDSAPRKQWQRMLAPLAAGRFAKGALLVQTKTKVTFGILIALVFAGAATWKLASRPATHGTPAVAATDRGAASAKPLAGLPGAPEATATGPAAPLPRHALVEATHAAGGLVGGRVVNWSTGDGVADAELVFAGDDGVRTLHTDAAGDFELASQHDGTYALVTIAAAGFLPYAPEYLHSPVRLHVTSGEAVRGARLFLFPAVDYFGHVVDAKGAPVAGAHVKLRGTPEQAIYRLATEWTSDRDGKFTFHAPDFAVLEATAGAKRGFGILDGKVAISKQLTITLGDAAARDASITGRVVDIEGHPVVDGLVSAEPADWRTGSTRVGASVTTAADGTFKIDGLDREPYDITAEAEGFAPARTPKIAGGTSDLKLVVDAGEIIAGTVATSTGEPVPAFTLLVNHRDGVLRQPVATRSVADPTGHFEVRVAPGKYELIAAAIGWAPSHPLTASSGTRDARIVVSAGAVVRGTVRSAAGGPVAYARVSDESIGGGASAVPANAGTVTRADGSFELTGVPAGALSIRIGADQFHERIEGGLTAVDGGELGPLNIDLTPLGPGESPNIELVGIGVALSAEHDALRVGHVYDGSGAQAVGIVEGDLITAVDGVGVTELGLEGAIAQIRGVVGTTVAITLSRGGTPVTLQVQRRKLRA